LWALIQIVIIASWAHRQLEMHKTPVVTAAQNMLIKKMGLSSPAELKMEDFEWYIRVLQEGLNEEQARLINELFAPHTPIVELPEDNEMVAV
jgi:hypothetical protein